MSYKVGMCDRDIGYVQGVMEYINKRNDVTLKIAAFSSEKAMEEYIKYNALDLIILGENITLNQKEIPVVHISGSRQKENILYKYQSGDALVKHILMIIKNNEIQKQNASFFNAVYSPLGRCGKTMFAQGLCKFSKSGLYINLEAYSGLDENVIPYTFEAGDKFIYYLVSRNVQILELLDNLPTCKDGFKTISGRTAIDVVSHITAEDINWFYKLLSGRSGYSCVVFDIGSSNISGIEILDEFERVYIPVLNDSISRIKLKRFADIIAISESCLEEKLKYINVPNVDYDREEMLDFIRNILV